MNMDDMMDIIPGITYGYIPSNVGSDEDAFDELPSRDWDDNV